MGFYFGVTTELSALAFMAAIQWRLGYRVNALIKSHLPLAPARLMRVVVRAILAAITLGLILSVPTASRLPLTPSLGWLRGVSLLWAFTSSAAWIVYRVLRLVRWRADEADPARRALLRTAGAAAVAAPFALVGFGTFVERTAFGIREIDIPIPDLHHDLEGLRLVQISDIHLSPFLSEREFARVVDAANGLRAHVMFVTGDLISVRGDPLDACLDQIARLRADAGTLGCLGNHEIYARTEEYTTVQAARMGVQFLRSQARRLRFGDATINVGGVDYQRMNKRAYYLPGAQRLLSPGALNILLSHNPDVFPVAAQQGWDFALSGHTHGGQVNFEILHYGLNVARFYTPYVYGLYTEGRSSIYVTRGIGTIGMPARLGAPPEISVLRLRKA
jgi:predicted MPP superfamily phosphohydrolase